MLTLRRARMCVYVCIRTLPAGAHTYTGFDTVGADRPYSAWILILHGRIHYRARIKDICILMDRAECIWRFIYAFRRVRATHPCLGGGECEKKKRKKEKRNHHPCPRSSPRGCIFVLFISSRLEECSFSRIPFEYFSCVIKKCESFSFDRRF